MSEIQNPYNQQQQMEQGMMPPPISPRGQWQRRTINAIGRAGKISFPKWMTQYAVMIYVMALAVVTLIYSSHNIPWYYMLSGVISIVVFFIYGSYIVNKTSVNRISSRISYERRLFTIAFVPRIVWMLAIYGIFMQNYGDAFGFENADAQYYHQLGGFVADQISRGDFHFYDNITGWSGGHDDISDMGYGIYVGFVYWMTGKSIIAVRLLKCIWSSFTVLLLYRLARRNFGEHTARIAAVFCALWPNFWYYCGTHLKETEMVFLSVLFVEQADQMLRSRQFTAWKVIPILLIAAAIFTFRTPLALVALLALLFSVVMSSTKVVSWGKRVVVGLLAVLLIGVTMGNRIEEQALKLWDQAQSSQQKDNLAWRARRDNGNAFAKYAGSAVFAPMIFTLPFPSMVRPFDGQDVQQLLNGGNFTKNIISFFTIIALFIILLSGSWREHMLPLAFMIGYLLVLAFSTFAQSERFHQPVMPFELMFAAYGLSIAVTKAKYKRWFTFWCGVMFVASIAWNWFKMAGRGLA